MIFLWKVCWFARDATALRTSVWLCGSTNAGRTEYGLKLGISLDSLSSASSAWPLTVPNRGVSRPGFVVAC